MKMCSSSSKSTSSESESSVTVVGKGVPNICAISFFNDASYDVAGHPGCNNGDVGGCCGGGVKGQEGEAQQGGRGANFQATPN
eukprot:15366606-Ditylum_brightwellii.AAC.2